MRMAVSDCMIRETGGFYVGIDGRCGVAEGCSMCVADLLEGVGADRGGNARDGVGDGQVAGHFFCRGSGGKM